jgi:hypothetical protein
MMQAILSYETAAVTRATRRHILEEGILHGHLLENLKSYFVNIFLHEYIPNGSVTY